MSVTEQLRSAPCGFRDNFGVKEVIINQDRWEAEVQRIAALEAENAALRAYRREAAAYMDAVADHWAKRSTETLAALDLAASYLQKAVDGLRQYETGGLPLPGAGEGA